MNARGFRLTLNTLVAGGFAAALVVPAITYSAPVGGFVGSKGQILSVPHPYVAPEWQSSYAARFPDCGSEASTTPGDLVIVDQDAHVRRVSFGVAWEANHNDAEADDVWVVGWCH